MVGAVAVAARMVAGSRTEARRRQNFIVLVETWMRSLGSGFGGGVDGVKILCGRV
jgi:hypothetical protein